MKFVKTLFLFLLLVFPAHSVAQTRVIIYAEGRAPAIMLNGAPAGFARLDTLLPHGAWELTVYSDVYRWDNVPLTEILSLSGSGDTVTRRIKEMNTVRPLPAKSLNTVEPRVPFIESTLFTSLAAAFIISGGAAAYLKHRADIEFDAYKLNAEQAALRRVKNLDRWSAAAFVSAQINFGLLVYFFLTNY